MRPMGVQWQCPSADLQREQEIVQTGLALV
jgi:hypothetical protein